MNNIKDRAIRAAPCGGAVVLQLVARVIPTQLGERAAALFVCVGRAVVGKQGEVRICARVYADRSNGLLLSCAEDRTPERQNGTGSNKERKRIDGCGSDNRLSALDPFVGPVVIPVASRGQ